jgi:hypothetical protein
MIDVAELSGAERVKQTFRAGKSLGPRPPTERAAVEDPYASFPGRDDVPPPEKREVTGKKFARRTRLSSVFYKPGAP